MTVGQKPLSLSLQTRTIFGFCMLLVFTSLEILEALDRSITRKINDPQRKRGASPDSENLTVELFKLRLLKKCKKQKLINS